MKGFLNKVQRRVSGSGPSGGEGEGEPAAPPGSPSSGTSPAKAAAAQAGRVGDGVPLAQVEVVPKADVTLPRKERRWGILFSPCLYSSVVFYFIFFITQAAIVCQAS